MGDARRLFLIGYRGTGKSSVARLVASRLGWRQADSDQQAEVAAGATVAEIFQQYGETRFREIEAETIARMATLEDAVLSLGGGAVLRASTRDILQTAGPVVLLTAEPQTIAERLRRDPATQSLRPSLTGRGVVDEVEQVLAERHAVYHACADLVVDTEGKTPEVVADEVLLKLSDLG